MQKSVNQLLKLNFLFVFLFVPSFLLKAHEYYFAFAEVEYNEKSSQIEASLIVTAHDFELYLSKRKVINTTIEEALLDSSQVIGVMTEINNHFIIAPQNSHELLNIDSNYFSLNTEFFQLDGYNIRLDGNLELYLSKKMNVNPERLMFSFNLMMNEFPGQQNKLTFIRQCKKSTFNFTLSNSIYFLEFY